VATRQLQGHSGHNKGQTLPPEPLAASEVVALLASMNRGATGDRNRPMAAVLYRSGLRLSEALALKASDVDSAAGTIRVLRGKGRRARTVGIDRGGLLYVERWIGRRKLLGLSAHTPLFCKLDGTPWAPQAVRAMLKTAADKAGIDKRVHPHGLRRTHAAELAREGVPTHAIQRQLGHASLAVTSRYLDHLSPADVIAVGRSRTWDIE
jgi:site-specific recombinase XerD